MTFKHTEMVNAEKIPQPFNEGKLVLQSIREN